MAKPRPHTAGLRQLAFVLLSLLLLPPAAFAYSCHRADLAAALAGGDVAWVRRKEAPGTPRYRHCAVLSARYNCTRLRTSAPDYRLDWRPWHWQGRPCDLPTHGNGALGGHAWPAAPPSRPKRPLPDPRPRRRICAHAPRPSLSPPF
jgi:hypothetical protein